MIRRTRHPWKRLVRKRPAPDTNLGEELAGDDDIGEGGVFDRMVNRFRRTPKATASLAAPAVKASAPAAKLALPVAKAAAQSTPQGKAASVVLNAALKDPNARAHIRRVVRDDPKANTAARALRANTAPRRPPPPSPVRPGPGDHLMVPAFAANTTRRRSSVLRAFEKGAG